MNNSDHIQLMKKKGVGRREEKRCDSRKQTPKWQTKSSVSKGRDCNLRIEIPVNNMSYATVHLYAFYRSHTLNSNCVRYAYKKQPYHC